MSAIAPEPDVLQSKSKLLQEYFQSADNLFLTSCDMLNFGLHEFDCVADKFGACELHLDHMQLRESALRKALEDYRQKANELKQSMNSGLKENANESK